MSEYPEWTAWALLAAMGTVAGAVTLYRQRAKERRRHEVAAFARKFNLAYGGSVEPGLNGYDFTLFARGDDRGFDNYISGTWRDTAFVAADYWYYVERDDNGAARDYRHFTVVVVDIDAYCPRLRIERESIATVLADTIMQRDINFESDEFNRKFRVTGDRAFAYDLLDARMLNFLVKADARFSYEIHRSWLLVWTKRLPPMELLPPIGLAREFRSRIPQLVRSRYALASHP